LKISSCTKIHSINQKWRFYKSISIATDVRRRRGFSECYQN